jgi:hypothetical protein
MKKIGKKPTDDQMLEGGGGGGGGGAGKVNTKTPWLGDGRVTGSRSASDRKEKEDKTPEVSGEISFGSPRSRNYDSGDRTPRMSDDYAKGGMTASKRADGCAVKGKTKGRFV